MLFSINYDDKSLEKSRACFFVSKFWQDKLSDFSRREHSVLMYFLQVFLLVLAECQSSFQELNFIAVLLSYGNLALITRDPF